MAQPENSGEDRTSGAVSSRGEGLALLYQGFLTVIVRIQSGKQKIPVDAGGFQRQMEALLNEIEREANKLGYRKQDINDAHFVVVAFLDETIRRSEDPNRVHWTPLQAKLYSEVRAGEAVYERVREIRSRRDSKDLAELLEIYNLCFLLGYEGKYALGGRSELERLMEDLEEQIERLRGHHPLLSPEGTLPQAPKVVMPANNRPNHWLRIGLVCAVCTIVSWFVLQLILNSYTEDAIRNMLTP